MSEEGEIPAKADEKPDEVVAAAVVDEDGSTGSGEVVVAAVVDDEEPPTPTTAKTEADIVKKAPPVPPNEDEDDKEEGEISTPAKEVPVKEPKVNETKETAVPAIAAAVEEVKTEPPPPVSTETKVDDAKAKDSEDKKVIPEEKKKASPPEAASEEGEVKENAPVAPVETKKEDTETKPPETKPAENPTDNAVKKEEPKPMEVEAPEPQPPAKKQEEPEDGEVEEGEVEEGEIEDTPAVEASKPTPAATEEKPPVKTNSADSKPDEGQTKMEEVKAEAEKKPEADKEMAADAKPTRTTQEEPAVETDEPTPMEVDEPKPKEKDTTTTTTTNIDTITPTTESTLTSTSTEAKKTEKKDDDEDGEIKEDVKATSKADDTDEEGEIKEDTEEEGEIKEDTEEEGEVKEEVKSEEPSKEDVEMEDASQSDEGGDRDSGMTSPDVDTASNDGDTASLVDEPTSRKVEPTYSTRGRASGTSTPVPRETPAKGSSVGSNTSSGAKPDQWERQMRESLEELGRSAKETPAGVGPGGASFLEALGEEERRTRTRFLPAVDGIHMLRKNEIKGDLALARSIMSSAGTVANVASVAGGASASSSSISKKSSKKKKNQDSSSRDGEAMDTDESGTHSSSEDDPSDGGRVGSISKIEVDPGDPLIVPSSAFVPPPAATHSAAAPSAANGEKKEDGAPPAPVSSGVKGILNNQRNIKSPKVVESVTAFNPPRPPESVGKKKQHRMLRWERRPADVEVDLNNYRKTVDRTRTELHTAEDELERVEATSNHLRRHFLGHLRCMDQETDEVLNELNSLQQKCVTTADLLTSRTRSRGAGKGTYVMRDVLTVLKARGAELKEKGLDLQAGPPASNGSTAKYFGMGGVGCAGFSDWNHRSEIKRQKIASAWVLEGDKVDTPCGEGVVVKIFENAALDVKEPPSETTLQKASNNGHSPKSAPETKKMHGTGLADGLSSYLDVRIAVRLPFGVGYFSPDVVSSKESPNTLSDAQLAKRWSGLVESALSQAGKLDMNGMAFVESQKVLSDSNTIEEDGSAKNGGVEAMDVDASGGAVSDPQAIDGSDSAEAKLLPFGSSLLSTGTGRANKLFDMHPTKLQKEVKHVLTNGEGVLGNKANEGVPPVVKDFEDERQKSYILQAKVFHLRNQLYRQRRIRTLNERTFAATRERSARVESLVAEMRTDLKSLRNRLDEELVELGIDPDRADAILKAYYLSQEGDDHEVDAEEEVDTSAAQKRLSEDGIVEGQNSGQLGEGEKPSENGSASPEIEREAKRAKIAVQ